MATGDVARILRAPGTVYLNPTDLSAASPYGGTAVGHTNLCALQPLGTPFRVEYESLGEAGDILEPNNAYVFVCFIRGWDDDAVNLFLHGEHEDGSTTQHAVFAEPGDSTPGESMLSRAVTLLYVPDDLIHVPGLIVYRGVPHWTEGSELAFQRGTELGIPLTLECVRDENGNTLRMGRFADLSLA